MQKFSKFFTRKGQSHTGIPEIDVDEARELVNDKPRRRSEDDARASEPISEYPVRSLTINETEFNLLLLLNFN